MSRTVFLNRAVLGGNITVAFAGLAFGGSQGVTLSVIVFLFLLIALRVKFWYDDEQYFEEVKSGRHDGGIPFFFGATLAVASWIVWMFAALFVKQVDLSALLMAIVMGISTFWIVAAMVKRGAYIEQIPWLFFNAIYVLGFLLIWFREAHWNPFRETFEVFTIVVTACLLLVFLLDLATTRILEQKRLAAASGTPSNPTGH
jgi:hypothetical protein